MNKAQRSIELFGKFVATTRREGIASAIFKSLFFMQRYLDIESTHRKNESLGIPSKRNSSSEILFVIGDKNRRYRSDALAGGFFELGYEVSIVVERMWKLAGNYRPPHSVVLFNSFFGAASPCSKIVAELRKMGTRIVYDYDAPYFVSESLDTMAELGAMSIQERSDLLARITFSREQMLYADAVTVANPFLAVEAKKIQPLVHVVPDSLSPNLLGLSEKLLVTGHAVKDKTSLIYCFYDAVNSNDDFSVCADAVKRFMIERRNVTLLLVGVANPPPEFSEFGKRVIVFPYLSPEHRFREIANADIALVPMGDTEFRRMSGGNELAEPFSVKTPVIVSKNHRDSARVKHGVNGMLAASVDDWHSCLVSLADAPELRMELADAARREFEAGDNYLDAAGVLAVSCGVAVRGSCKPKKYAPVFLSKPNFNKLRISWIFTDYMIGSGGHRNIFRTAHELAKRGHEIDFYVLDTDLEDGQLLRSIRKYYYPTKCRAFKFRGHIEKCDCLFATHWKTVDVALSHRHAARETMYFIQDFEPYFHSMGSDYIRAENTYRRRMYCITAGSWCTHFLKKSYGCEADHLQFPIDRSVYFVRKRKKRRKNIVFFAKPEMPRRCYDIGIAALEKFHSLCPDLEIIFFGSNQVNASTLSFPVTVRGTVYSLVELAELYSNADLGVVFSPTNPSFVPYEMMACGCPVVDIDRGDNDYNYGHRRDIAFLANPLPEIMADQMNSLLADSDEIDRRRQNGLDFIQTFPTLEDMGERVNSLIRARLEMAVTV